jgi:hypothetical protein
LVNEKNHLVQETVTLSLLSALIQSATRLVNQQTPRGLPDLIMLMNTLACAGTGLGHLYLFQACCIWLEYFAHLNTDQLANSGEYDVLKQSDKPSNQQQEQMDLLLKSACYILTYVCEVGK